MNPRGQTHGGLITWQSFVKLAAKTYVNYCLYENTAKATSKVDDYKAKHCIDETYNTRNKNDQNEWIKRRL